MSKYHLGDEFVVEIKEVLESNNGTLYRSNFSTLVFDDYGLDKLQKYDEIGRRLELIDELKQAEYNRGLADAWELAKKIVLDGDRGGFSCSELESIFDTVYPSDILEELSCKEVLAKIEAYEKEKSEIKVGDVVEYKNTLKAVVTRIENCDEVYVLWGDGSCGKMKRNEALKNGKTAEGLTDLLRQIGE